MNDVSDRRRGEPAVSVLVSGERACRETGDALGVVAVRAALEERERAVRETPDVVRGRRRNGRKRRELEGDGRRAERQLAEERELEARLARRRDRLWWRARKAVDAKQESRLAVVELDR